MLFQYNFISWFLSLSLSISLCLYLSIYLSLLNTVQSSTVVFYQFFPSLYAVICTFLLSVLCGDIAQMAIMQQYFYIIMIIMYQ